MGAPAPVTISALTTIIVQNGHAVTVSGNRNVRNLTVHNGGTLSLGSGDLTVNGTTVSVDGTISGGTGLLRIASANADTLSGTGTVDLNDLTVETPAGLNASANVDIRGTLLLNGGTYTSNTTKLKSSLSGTGRLGPLSSRGQLGSPFNEGVVVAVRGRGVARRPFAAAGWPGDGEAVLPGAGGLGR